MICWDVVPPFAPPPLFRPVSTIGTCVISYPPALRRHFCCFVTQQVRKAFAELIVEMAEYEYLELEGGQELVEFIVANAGLCPSTCLGGWLRAVAGVPVTGSGLFFSRC